MGLGEDVEPENVNVEVGECPSASPAMEPMNHKAKCDMPVGKTEFVFGLAQTWTTTVPL